MAEVTLQHVRKSFGATQVIKGVDLSIPHGSFVVFVGPSGCGKSTLLRLIAGLENVSSGDIRIGGDVVTRAEPYDRGIAMVFQSYALYPHMTVAENMGFALMLQGASVEARRDAVGKAAKILQINHLLDRKPAQLSGGQRQRVAIGRAIVRQPKVFLFDEPLSNLDAELRAQTRIEIARLHKSLGATMIYVTHDQVEAMTLADQIVVLRDGLIEQTGSPTELYDNPDNSFVAGFIGSPKMNLFEARVLDGNRAEVGGHQLPLPKLETALAPGTSIQLGIRPEAFSGSSGREIEVEVDVVEMLGSESLVHAWLAPDIPIVIEVRGSRPSAGDRMAIRLDPGRMLVFHATHGRRLR